MSKTFLNISNFYEEMEEDEDKSGVGGNSFHSNNNEIFLPFENIDVRGN